MAKKQNSRENITVESKKVKMNKEDEIGLEGEAQKFIVIIHNVP